MAAKEREKEVNLVDRGIRLMLEEALGREEKLGDGSNSDFWVGKAVCWEMCHCPPAIRDECPATKYTSLPCWEIEGTYCKLENKGPVVTGTDTSICEVCKVHKKYGGDKSVELKLYGRGIKTSIPRRA